MASIVGAAPVTTPVDILSPSPLGQFPTFFPGKTPGIAPFDYYYQFEVAAPNVGVSATINFNPAGAVTGFEGCVHAAVCAAGICTYDHAVLAGSFVSTSATELTLSTLSLAPGTYVFHIVGTSSSVSTAVSGQASASPVPAPGVLGLLAIGMLGLGASARRRV
jgi:hypothetical protein